MVFTGHGGIRAGDGTPVTVPEGTSVAMYGEHGKDISHYKGTLIETGDPKPLELYKPGEQLPDYSLFPPGGLDVSGRTVRHEVRLSQLLLPNMGRVHWSACRSIMKADTPLL
ncbi:putative adhesin [Streptomyces sp. NPDC000941]